MELEEAVPDDVEAFVRDRLDGDYVAVTGKAIADAVDGGRPVEVNYQPGDGTSYGLVFVPVHDLDAAAGRVAPIRGLGDGPVDWGSRIPLGVPRRRGSYLIVWVGHGATALDLNVGPGAYVAGYLNQYFRGASLASCYALQALLDAVSDGLKEDK